MYAQNDEYHMHRHMHDPMRHVHSRIMPFKPRMGHEGMSQAETGDGRKIIISAIYSIYIVIYKIYNLMHTRALAARPYGL